MEILSIVVGLIGLTIGVKILTRLNRVLRLLEQPVARKMPQDMKVRLGMRSQREAQRSGDTGRTDGQKNDNNRGERGDRNRDRNDRDRNRDRNRQGNGDRQNNGNRDQQRRRNRFEAPTEVMGNESNAAPEVSEAPVRSESATAPQEYNSSNRPPLAPRGGDRQAETVASAAPVSVAAEAPVRSEPVAASHDAVRFGRRTVVKRSPELDGDE